MILGVPKLTNNRTPTFWNQQKKSQVCELHGNVHGLTLAALPGQLLLPLSCLSSKNNKKREVNGNVDFLKFILTREMKRQHQICGQNVLLHRVFCSQNITLHAAGGQVLLWTLLPASLDSLEGVHGKPGKGIACLAYKQSRLANSLGNLEGKQRLTREICWEWLQPSHHREMLVDTTAMPTASV